MDSHRPQMYAFRVADLEAEQGSLDVYTSAPTHSLKAVTASAISFLDYDGSQSPKPAHHMDSGIQHDAAVNRLHDELDRYLSEPRMEPSKVTGQATVGYCDPLRYWAVCIFPCFGGDFSALLQASEKKFPYLFQLAMDILPAQASSVSCERVFSSSKETCTPRRNRINPELMEALQILKFSFHGSIIQFKCVDNPVELDEENPS